MTQMLMIFGGGERIFVYQSYHMVLYHLDHLDPEAMCPMYEYI